MATFCDLPSELLFEITHYISFKDQARWILSNRHHEARLSPVLYGRLLRSTQLPSFNTITSTTPKLSVFLIARWAAEHGQIGTLRKLDAIEDISEFINGHATVLSYGLPCFPSSSYCHGMTLLHIAALYGQAQMVKFLLSQGADPSKTVAGGLLPLHFAKNAATVRILVQAGTSVDTPSASQLTPLTYILYKNPDLTAVIALLDLGANPNALGNSGDTPAEVALTRGRIDALELLLKAGADVTRPLPRGGFLIFKAIIHLPIYHGPQTALRAVRLLLGHGAPPNAGRVRLNYEGLVCFTPNIVPAALMAGSPDMLELLLNHGANQHRAGTNWTERHSGRRYGEDFYFSLTSGLLPRLVQSSVEDTGFFYEDTIRKAQLLVDHGADVNTTIMSTPLLRYCLNCASVERCISLSFIPMLLAAGATWSNWFTATLEPVFPIHILFDAVLSQIMRHGVMSFYRKRQGIELIKEAVDLMIGRGQDINQRDGEGRTPLMQACNADHISRPMIQFLLDRGADINAADNEGSTALHCITRVARPFGYCGTAPLETLLNHPGVIVDARDNFGKTPLHNLAGLLLSEYAHKRRPGEPDPRSHAVHLLIKHGADVHAKTDKSQRPGATPLHLACFNNDARLITTLMKHGADADVNARTKDGWTPLMELARGAVSELMGRNDLLAMIHPLRRAGMRPELKDPEGRTALDIFRASIDDSLPRVFEPCYEVFSGPWRPNKGGVVREFGRLWSWRKPGLE